MLRYSETLPPSIYRFESRHRFLNCVINKISSEGDFRGGQRGRNCNFIRATSLNLIKLSQFSSHYRNSCENFPFNLCVYRAINTVQVTIIILLFKQIRYLERHLYPIYFRAPPALFISSETFHYFTKNYDCTA